MNSNCSNLLYLRNLQEKVKKAFCYQKLFWPFTVRTNCSSDLKIFANSLPLASNFKQFSRSLEQFFPTVGQNNFGNKIPNNSFKHSCCHIHGQINLAKLQLAHKQFAFPFIQKYLWNFSIPKYVPKYALKFVLHT